MKSIKAKLFSVYALIFISLSLTIFSSYIAVDTSNQHLMLSELLAEQKLQVELILSNTFNASTIRIIDEAYYQDNFQETLDLVDANKKAIDQVLESFLSRTYFFNGEEQTLKFEGDFEVIFINALSNAKDNWGEANNDIDFLLAPDSQIDMNYSKARDDFTKINRTMIDDVDLIARLCREEADRQRKISSFLQVSTMILTALIFVWLVYFVKKSIQDPILDIRKVFSKMGTGDFEVSLERDADDEFKMLFQDFNQFIKNKHVIDKIENDILSEDNLRVVLKDMRKEFEDFVELEKIDIYYMDSFENKMLIESNELIAKQVEEIPVYDQIVCDQPTSLIMPIHVNQVYLGYAKFYKRTAYTERDVKFVSGLSQKINFAFYKSLLFKDLLSIVTNALADLTESRDPETRKHLIRMSMYSQIMAEHLYKKGMYEEVVDEEFIDNILLAAPMHDIGKVSVPDSILLKPGKLTEEEFEIMKSHTCEGAKVLKRINERFSRYNIKYFRMAQDIAHFHQEKFNGTGYPEKISGYDIPLEARICTITDVFDALTSKRPYKEAFSLEKSYSIIRESSGSHFDPELVDIFFEVQDKIEAVYYEYREV